jgi:hypothetical protein
MYFLNNNILVLEKNSGRVNSIINDKSRSESLFQKPVLNQSERGMLGIASVNDKDHTTVFLYFTE